MAARALVDLMLLYGDPAALAADADADADVALAANAQPMALLERLINVPLSSTLRATAIEGCEQMRRRDV